MADQATEATITNLAARTGRSLEGWLAIVGESGLAGHGQIVRFLEDGHGLTHGYANLIAHRYVGAGPEPS